MATFSVEPDKPESREVVLVSHADQTPLGGTRPSGLQNWKTGRSATQPASWWYKTVVGTDGFAECVVG